jgi:dUTP pyrophosphatase
MLVPTGLFVKLSPFCLDHQLKNYSLRLHPRSGLSYKRGLVLANAEAVIDIDYQHQIFVLLTNISAVTEYIKVGDRICQAEVVQNCPVTFVEVFAPPIGYDSTRSGGFGSTGV